MRQTIIHPVPGVSTEGGAADWVPILDGVNILGIVPKLEFWVGCFNRGCHLGANFGWGFNWRFTIMDPCNMSTKMA